MATGGNDQLVVLDALGLAVAVHLNHLATSIDLRGTSEDQLHALLAAPLGTAECQLVGVSVLEEATQLHSVVSRITLLADDADL